MDFSTPKEKLPQSNEINTADLDHALYQDGDGIREARHLHRRLSNRQIQLIAIGGSIGTALFISIGTPLAHGGPGSVYCLQLHACPRQQLHLGDDCLHASIRRLYTLGRKMGRRRIRVHGRLELLYLRGDTDTF
jgi:hypothetical protein